MTAGRSRTESARANASSRSARSCPARSQIGRRDLASSRSAVSALDLAPPAAIARQPLAQLCGGTAQQALVLLVAHRVDPVAQRLAARTLEQLAQTPSVLDGDRLPAGGLEHAAQAPGRHLGHDAVERLPVEVDDPQDLAQARHHRIDERLPDGAFIELGIAHERDMAAALRHVEVPGHVALGDRAPERRRRADPDASPSRSRRRPDPWRGSGSSAARRTRAASSGSSRSSVPSR